MSLNGYLPYYGEWLPDDVLGSGDPHDGKEKRRGRFPNPTVHIGLGQLRRVVNALIRQYGPPGEIVVEMTRDFKLSPRQVTEIEKEQAKTSAATRRGVPTRQARAAGQRAKSPEDAVVGGVDPARPARPLLPLYGREISHRPLLSEEVDMDHLIPFPQSWDDSAANKIVCLRHANRAKRKQTPFEAFGGNPMINVHPYDWEQISARAAVLPRNKRWRFQPDAHRAV